MSTRGRSPGPWKGNISGEIEDANGTLVALVVDNPDDGSAGLGQEPSDFNQALIEAAPEVLLELEALVEIICGGEREVTVEDCDDAKAAIAKATGACV